MKNFFAKVKNWFIAHKPTKRRIIQVYAELLYNAQLKGFFTGKIYTGDTKKLCVPGLNCYSCPGAVGACPLGALQDSLAQSGTTAPAYIFGILILFGLLLGRVVCGFLCPFGLIQDLLYKIRTPKLRKSRFTRILSYFKYVLLAIVIAIPIIYAGIPSFCKYVCPAGTFEGAVGLLANIKNSDFFGMLGYLFTWKFCVLVVVVVASIFIYRFFCRFICPLGAIYSLFCKISMLGVKLDKNKCIDCGLCIQGCKMDIKHVGDHECIQCGECISVCPVQAISWKGSKIFLRNTSPLAQPVAAEGEKIELLEIAKSNAGAAVVNTARHGADNADEIKSAEVASGLTETAVVKTENIAENVETNVAPDGAAEKGKKLKAVKQAFKRPRFVVEFVAWVLATVLLLTALICYNLPDKKVDSIPVITLTTYKSAVKNEGESYSTSDGKSVKVLYFWRTDLEESVEGIAAMNGFAESVKGFAEVVAIHSIYKD
ncbi:MAG: 4Fe-4S binding protein, partial [Clostridia bacterium]|nr:4Fe-4S binding protein [Clostridia bacterium]